MSIREQNEAEQAVTDLQGRLFINARRSARGGRLESLEDVIEKQAKLLRQIATRSPAAVRQIEQFERREQETKLEIVG